MDAPAFQKALERFAAENARDPNLEIAGGAGQPRESLYARRLTDWVLKLAPEAAGGVRPAYLPLDYPAQFAADDAGRLSALAQ